MKFFKILTVATFLLLVSCKKNKSSAAIDALSGHWHVSNFEAIDTSDATPIADEVVSQLVTSGCFPLEFSFTTEGNVTNTDKMSKLEVTQGEQGVEVDCFFENVFRQGTFDVNDDTLILNFENETVQVNFSVNGDMLIIPVYNTVLDGKNVSGKVFFTREDF